MSPARVSRFESAVRLVLALHEAYNHHDVAGMTHLLSPDCVLETSDPAPDGKVYKGKEAIAHYWQSVFDASPQAHLVIEEIVGLGLWCILRWRYEWIDAAGNKGHRRGVDIFQEKGGLICEQFSYVKG